MRMLRLLGHLACAVVLSGCGVLGDLIGPEQVVPLEVWNRTLEPMFLIDEDGRRIDVPACGHSDPALIRVDAVRVRTEDGYVFGFGSGGLDGGRQYLVLVAADGESFPTLSLPLSIPPCQGRPNVQVGV